MDAVILAIEFFLWDFCFKMMLPSTLLERNAYKDIIA